MTPEQKELLIKDLCARLPYGVKVQSKDVGRLVEVWGIFGDLILHELTMEEKSNGFPIISSRSLIEECKPILFPLSAINEYLDISGEQICVRYLIEGNFKHSFYIENDGDVDIEMSEASYIYLEEYSFILDAFNKYHIDYRDLIGQGLAISVFDLPENPYK